MNGRNLCIFIGNVVAQPDIKYLDDDKQVCNFSIAVNTGWGDKEQVEFVNVVAWNKLAGICAEFLTKGKPVYIEGRLQTRSWDDKEGNKRYMTEVVCNQMVMLGGKGESEPQPQGAGNPQVDDNEPPPF